MKLSHLRTTVVAATTALALPLSLGFLAPQAFGQSPSPSPSTTSSSSSPSPSTSPSTSSSTSPSASTPFGPGCSSLPGGGTNLAAEPLASAAAHDPHLSILVGAVTRAGLTGMLNHAKDTTLFAPTNAAFHKLGKAKAASLLRNRAALKKLLSYHVVDEKIAPSQLPHGTFTTLEGASISTSGSGTSFTVNKTAKIICGNINAANGKVYIINNVLTPPTS
ncbi:fasciclin domain-containing protein [Streptomyces sp. NPDC088725]|uniref:fasciclin domain-containing protein n=1 Tax=Streptomyces sp. NPDC088725 TaxID=3365873 RepID=UPI00380E3248